MAKHYWPHCLSSLFVVIWLYYIYIEKKMNNIFNACCSILFQIYTATRLLIVEIDCKRNTHMGEKNYARSHTYIIFTVSYVIVLYIWESYKLFINLMYAHFILDIISSKYIFNLILFSYPTTKIVCVYSISPQPQINTRICVCVNLQYNM